VITNERQYRVTKSQLKKLEKSIPENGASRGKLDPRLRAAVQDRLQPQIDELQEQIAEYEHLKEISVSDLRLGTDQPASSASCKSQTHLASNCIA
jgi:hypothetical protein